MANYALPFTGLQVENAIKLVTNSVAPPFSATSPYTKGDTVVYNGLLYAAKTDLTAGDWSTENWETVKIFDNNGYLIISGGNSTN